MAKKQNDEKNPFVFIKLDRPRYLRFGHKALKQLSALTGRSLSNISDEDFDLGELEKIIYCGLLSDAKEHGENLQLEDMEDLLDRAESFTDIVEAMNKALDSAFQKTEKQKN